MTLFNFLESGIVKIPTFQRDFVWELTRASKLIESILIGLPIPQIFLYEQGRNNFLVIDGQQRLMSIYYFMKGRFPKSEKRIELRKIVEAQGTIPDVILEDDAYFSKFNLRLPEQEPGNSNRFNRRNYATLEEYRTTFDLRTIRNIIIKQNLSGNDDSAMYEIFHRLNSGGVKLKPQEIRMSIYYSAYYSMLSTVNQSESWRSLIGTAEPDLRLKDLEVLVRAAAMLVDGATYNPSMTKFLNGFSRKARGFDQATIDYHRVLFESFFEAYSSLSEGIFQVRGRFNISLFEAVFYVVCNQTFASHSLVNNPVREEAVTQLRADADFMAASTQGAAGTTNVATRLRRANAVFNGQP
ncbi:MAG: DUF262 domain-containing protein [Chloroflexi bacterium]|nr:DUF262 domain-containing protein [Chloroflexota bacterium]